MTTTIESLAAFVVGTPADAIPDEVVEYSKLLLCDTVVCALATAELERGAMARNLARRMGGRGESLLLGSADRTSVLSASYANADLMNVLDADETFFNSAHFAAMSFAPALARAEQGRASGAELVRAAALSFDVNARLNLGTSLLEYDGEQIRFSQLSSHGYAALGAAAAMGVLGGFVTEQLAHAMGLATWLTPTAKNGYMGSRRRFNSLKYAPNGQIAHAGVTAAMMAAEGYIGDVDSLDTQPGFLEAQGYRGGDRAAILADLGSMWWITETSVKPYPACRFAHAALDAVLEFQRTRSVDLDDIERVEVRLGPGAYSISQFRDPLPELPDDHTGTFAGQFNMPHLVAAALLGVPAGPKWFSAAMIDDPRVRALASRVVVTEDPVLRKEWQDTLAAESGGKMRRTRGSITVHTRSGAVDFETDFALGDPWADATRASWSMLEDKIAGFCEGIIDSGRRARMVSAFRDLDKIDDVAAELVPLLTVNAGEAVR